MEISWSCNQTNICDIWVWLVYLGLGLLLLRICILYFWKDWFPCKTSTYSGQCKVSILLASLLALVRVSEEVGNRSLAIPIALSLYFYVYLILYLCDFVSPVDSSDLNVLACLKLLNLSPVSIMRAQSLCRSQTTVFKRRSPRRSHPRCLIGDSS